MTGDYNEDGHLDILMDDMGNDLILLPGKGDGTFGQPALLGLGASGLFAVADLNNDKHLDLVAGRLEGNVGVFLGTGKGTFNPNGTLDSVVIAFAPPSGEILIGDLNNDGKADVAVASVPDNSQRGLGTLDVFLGNGDGAFQDAIRTEDVAARRGALGDFDGDGNLDFAGDRTGPSQVEIWLGRGDGHFTKGQSLPLTYQAVWMLKVADLNSDGIADLAVTGAPALPLNVFLGIGDGTFRLRENFIPAAGFQVAVTAPDVVDVNADGLPDLMGLSVNPANPLEEVLTVALNAGLKKDTTRGYILTVDGSSLAGITPGPVALELSTDLRIWTALSTNEFARGYWALNLTTTGAINGFYRARQK